MSRRRVVVTGLGCISPVGNTVEQSWASLLAGKSGIDLITSSTHPLRLQVRGRGQGFRSGVLHPAKEARTWTPSSTRHCRAVQAVADAACPRARRWTMNWRTRIGCNIGSGIGGLPMIEQHARPNSLNRGPRRISPFFVPASIINMIAGHVSIRFGFKGPNIAIVTACTTGLHCIGEAGAHDRVRRRRRHGGRRRRGHGLAAGHRRLRGHARAVHPQRRPQDGLAPLGPDRDGFVLGEGAGVLVLEELRACQGARRRIYAELAGFGMSADAGHMTAPNMDGPRRSMVMRCAMPASTPTEVTT
jgi:3-oxoacyl-[acyl-carrier-protein] synthase II